MALPRMTADEALEKFEIALNTAREKSDEGEELQQGLTTVASRLLDRIIALEATNAQQKIIIDELKDENEELSAEIATLRQTQGAAQPQTPENFAAKKSPLVNNSAVRQNSNNRNNEAASPALQLPIAVMHRRY